MQRINETKTLVLKKRNMVEKYPEKLAKMKFKKFLN